MTNPDNDSLGRVGVIVAARTGSTRLPGKALRRLGGKEMILFLLERIRESREADVIVFATTTLSEDDVLAACVAGTGYPVFRGANADVVARYVAAAREYNIDTVVRVTGDCPFVDAQTLDFVIAAARLAAPFDLVTTKGAFPVGIDYEIYPAALMAKLDAGNALSELDREHLTYHLYQHPDAYRIHIVEPRPQWRYDAQTFTVDTIDDFGVAEKTVGLMGKGDFSVTELIEAVCRAS
jgi:spore coat polysaccharide biosynthesis protein SpsF